MAAKNASMESFQNEILPEIYVLSHRLVASVNFERKLARFFANRGWRHLPPFVMDNEFFGMNIVPMSAGTCTAFIPVSYTHLTLPTIYSV